MRKWFVTLPDHQIYTLESDTPAMDLNAMGYRAFALMELDLAAMKLWRTYPPVPGSICKSRQFGGRKEEKEAWEKLLISLSKRPRSGGT